MGRVLSAERNDRRVFATLDGLRGVAAIFVAMRHIAFFKAMNIHGGYMAVDLFFVLSGFVIAHAYERRFERGLTVGRFLASRYLRLWPVYVLGAVLGLIAAASHALPGRDNLTGAEVLRTAPFALTMLPGPHIKPMLYPVNSVAWSLALELLINAAYAFAWKPLKDSRVLAATLAGSAAALVYACWHYGKLDIGFMWKDWLGGLPRVAFSFTAGLAVYRLYQSKLARPRLPAWIALAVLPPLMWVRLDEFVFPLLCVLAVFPALVLVAADAQPGARSAGLFERLGAISYPLYALHKPLGEMAIYLVRHQAPQLERLGPWIGAPFLAALMALCVVVDRAYDRPFRTLLMAGLDDLFAGFGRLRGAIAQTRADA